MATSAHFVPVQPPRTADWMPGWRGLFGERLRNTVYGWPEPAFDEFYRKRRILGFTVHIVTDPDIVERVLLGNKENYLRPRIAQRILSPLIGNGLLSAEGEDWKKQRRIVAPTFAPGAVASMSRAIAEVAARQTGVWLRGTIRTDMARAATDATMQIIADTLFSSDARLTTRAAGEHIDNLVLASGQARISTILGLQDFDISPVMARARRGRVYLRNTLTALVRERGPTGGAADFFGGLIRALYEQFPPAEAEALAVDNAITFYVAGHETTANALAWTIYLLAAQPGLQEEARAEAVTALAGDIATLADRLPLLRQILDEAMRLYPPAPRFDREAQAADHLGDAEIAAGDLISLWPWVMHRHRKLWDNPDAFDHTRFAPEAKAKLHRFQYIPFGGGQRVCVGARFAIVEALIILAHWLAARRFSLPSDFTPYPMGTVTLRPKGGMWLQMEPI
ncbi:MAG: cytochrome P450 [Sphingomonadales bacterium]|jgi:cytochrome P450|nr:cytochrome P450 [Sphingomonadales bacterium]MBK6719838.1 cytochrome P450 [Sphingomonadales bacterium]MBK8861385.1 cytochrome P450 [Sphingomonadales bacterium]